MRHLRRRCRDEQAEEGADAAAADLGGAGRAVGDDRADPDRAHPPKRGPQRIDRRAALNAIIFRLPMEPSPEGVPGRQLGPPHVPAVGWPADLRPHLGRLVAAAGTKGQAVSTQSMPLFVFPGELVALLVERCERLGLVATVYEPPLTRDCHGWTGDLRLSPADWRRHVAGQRRIMLHPSSDGPTPAWGEVVTASVGST